jgi:hypothetical protein
MFARGFNGSVLLFSKIRPYSVFAALLRHSLDCGGKPPVCRENPEPRQAGGSPPRNTSQSPYSQQKLKCSLRHFHMLFISGAIGFLRVPETAFVSRHHFGVRHLDAALDSLSAVLQKHGAFIFQGPMHGASSYSTELAGKDTLRACTNPAG